MVDAQAVLVQRSCPAKNPLARAKPKDQLAKYSSILTTFDKLRYARQDMSIGQLEEDLS